jgi:hypothetical protein
MSEGAGKLIMELHFQGPKDSTPMQMVSAARLAYFDQLELEVVALRAAIQRLEKGCVGPAKLQTPALLR